MLQRIEHRDGPAYYVSELLAQAGVKHGFSTRLGGVSGGPFASLNLGNPQGAVQDDPGNIAQNEGRFLAALGLAPDALRKVKQVHGAQVVRGDGPADACTRWDADALVSKTAGIGVSVRVADCVPILIATADGRIVAAVHAGWKGVIANVVGAAVKAMEELGARPGDLLAAVGPCIGFAAFEVGIEVAEQFEQAFAGEPIVRRRDDGKALVDLKGAVRRQLLASGLAESSVEVSDRCTVTHGDEFFSHRRDGGVTGRMSAVIAAR